MDRIRQYYLLCTVRNGGKAHMVEQVHDQIDKIYKAREVTVYFKQLSGKYIIRENIVGGAARSRIIVL